MARPTILSNFIANVGGQPGYQDVLALLGLSQGPGRRFFVDSNGPTRGSSGGAHITEPVNTLTAGLAKVLANKCDTVCVLPGHAETISTIDFSATGGHGGGSVAGVTVQGFGTGTLKPTFTFNTTTDQFNIDVANVTIRNLRFVSDVDSLVCFLDINEGNFVCEDCDFVTSSAKEALVFADIATTKDNVTFRRCKFYQPTDPAGTDGGAGTGCFYFVDSEDLFFEDCFFYGNFETAIWHNKTTAAKNVWIRNCYGTQLLAGAEIMLHVAAMEGGVLNSHFNVPNAADVTDTTVWSGTMSDKFAIGYGSGVLADGAAGGQWAAPGSAANS